MFFLYLGIAVLSLFIVLFIYIFFFGPRLGKDINLILDEVLQSSLDGVILGETGFANANTLQVWYESIPPKSESKGIILLNVSMAGNALDWPPDFVRVLVRAGYQVIRYDSRCTGLSDRMKKWKRKEAYSIADMAGDAIAVLDANNVQKAHILGLSMGGMVAQEIAIQAPHRVSSLILIMTTGYAVDPELPGLSSSFFFGTLWKGLPLLKYRLLGGEKNILRERIAKMLSIMNKEDIDIKSISESALYDHRERKGVNFGAIFQHQAAVSIAGSRYEKLKALDIPALVIHGTKDKFFPIEHGKKLAETIPKARLLLLEGMAHGFPIPKSYRSNETILSFLEQVKSEHS